MNGYLFDTNVVSESYKDKPHQRVARRLRQLPQDQLYISVLALGEIRKGIEKLSPGSKRTRLAHWLEYELPVWFDTHILDITRDVADCWGHLMADAKRTLPAADGLLAATAIAHDLVVVTRNDRDFKFPGLEVYNPWTDD